MKWHEWNQRGLIPGPNEDEESFLSRVAGAKVANVPPVEPFGITPDWVEVTESNQGLLPWHGAVMATDGRKAAVQLRASLPWFYNRNELLLHELVHAGRCAFQEPKYEEFFAYRTSQRWFRRWLGPVIVRPWEVWLLLAAMSVGAWEPLAPLAVITVGLARLFWRHWKLRRCVRWLYKRVGARAWEVAYRLTDREIAQSSQMCADGSLRWQMLSAVYGLDC